MKRALLITLTFLATAVPLHADFNSVVSAIEETSGLHRVSIPFMGLARVALWMVKPKGIYDFQIATWEGAVPVDRANAATIIRRSAGRGYSPVIESVSSRTGEWAFIYARPHGKHAIDLLIVSHDHSDTAVVRAVVDAAMVIENFGSPNNLSHVGRE